MHAPKSKERLQDKRHFRRSLKQLIPDEHLVIVRNHHDGLGEEDASYLIGDYRNRIGVKVHNVLVSSRLIRVTVAVNAEVELLAPEDKAFIQGGQQHVPSSTQFPYGNGKKPVIAPCVAGHDGRVAIGPRLACGDNLTLERILEIDKFGLVEF